MLEAISDLIPNGDRISIDGYWSGTENRHHEHYVAVIPESRYVDETEQKQSSVAPERIEKKRFPAPETLSANEQVRDDLTNLYVNMDVRNTALLSRLREDDDFYTVAAFGDRVADEILKHGFEAGRRMMKESGWRPWNKFV